MGTYASGTPEEQRKFRSIALDRNQSSCILQIRMMYQRNMLLFNGLILAFIAIALMFRSFTNISDTPAKYKYATDDAQPDKSAYWLNKLLEVIVEPRYHEFINEVNDFRERCQSYGVGRVDTITKTAQIQNSANLINYLTEQNMKNC